MASFTSLYSSMSDTPMISVPAYSSSSSSLVAGVDDAFEDDACSICLDPFTPQEPATDTCCKHEYHLQCILEWSQRSKECPICWQLLVLKDPASQELIAAVETERLFRPRNSNPASMTVHHLDEDYDIEQMTLISTSMFCSIYLLLLPAELVMFAKGRGIRLPDLVPPRILFRQPPTIPPQGQGSSDACSLSDSIKSKWFAASARYKESLSKGTRGMKEKLLARNNSVKELSKEVQSEMSAGIAGVARMIERLDLTSKHTAPSMSDSDFTGGITNFSWKGKGVEQNIIAQALTKKSEEIAHDTSLGASSRASATVPAQVEISHVQNLGGLKQNGRIILLLCMIGESTFPEYHVLILHHRQLRRHNIPF